MASVPKQGGIERIKVTWGSTSNQLKHGYQLNLPVKVKETDVIMTHLTTLCPSIYKSTVVSVTARIRRVTRLERLLNWRLVGYNVSFILLTRPLCIYLSIHVFPWSSIVQSLKLPTWLGALEFSPRLDVSYRLHCIQFFSARPLYLSIYPCFSSVVLLLRRLIWLC